MTASECGAHGRELPQVRSFEQLHRVIRTLCIDAVIVDFDDPRVPERREDVEFALEEGCCTGWRVRSQTLQRDAPIRRQIDGGEHGSHTAVCELRFDSKAIPERRRIAQRRRHENLPYTPAPARRAFSSTTDASDEHE